MDEKYIAPEKIKVRGARVHNLKNIKNLVGSKDVKVTFQVNK